MHEIFLRQHQPGAFSNLLHKPDRVHFRAQCSPTATPNASSTFVRCSLDADLKYFDQDPGAQPGYGWYTDSSGKQSRYLNGQALGIDYSQLPAQDPGFDPRKQLQTDERKDYFDQAFTNEGSRDAQGGYHPEVINNRPWTDKKGVQHDPTYAAGMFQLMPSTVKGNPALQQALGVTPQTPDKDIAAAISHMPKDEQMSKLWPLYTGGKEPANEDIYTQIAGPAGVGQPGAKILYPAGSDEATANPSWQDKNGNVTVDSIRAKGNPYGQALPSGGQPAVGPTFGSGLNSAGQPMLESRTQSETTHGAPFTPEQTADVTGAYAQRGRAIQMAADTAQMQQYGAATQAYREYLDPNSATNQEMQRNKTIRDNAERMANEDIARVQASDQDLAQRINKFNPNRLFDEQLGTAGTLAAAFFQAIGAMAQAKGRLASNPAKDIIDAAIQRDILQQQKQIDETKGRADNALRRYQMSFGSANVARAALEHSMQNYAALGLHSYALATGIPEIVANSQKFLADNQLQQSQSLAGIRDKAVGDHTTTLNEKTPQPNYAQLATQQRFEQSQLNKYGKDVGPYMRVKKNAVDLIHEMGYDYNPKTNDVTIPAGADISGVGTFDAHLPGRLLPHNSTALQGLDNLLLDYNNVLSKRVSEPEVRRRIEAVKGLLGTEEGTRKGIEMMLKDIAAQEENAQRTYGPNTARRYQENGPPDESELDLTPVQ